MEEIERKWILRILPKMRLGVPIKIQRDFLDITEVSEERIQKVGQKLFEKEKKEVVSDLVSKKQKTPISKEQYNEFKSNSIGTVTYYKYNISHIPRCSIKEYLEKHEGLVRVEVEFGSVEEAKKYVPPKWFGREITGSFIASDKKVVGYDNEELRKMVDLAL